MKTARLLLLCSLVMLGAATAQAARLVQMNLQLANGSSSGGLAVPNRWNYIGVVVTNNQEPFEGELVVRPKAPFGMAYRQSVSIGRTRKRFFLYFIATEGVGRYAVDLVDRATGKSVAVQEFSVQPKHARVVLTVGNPLSLADGVRNFDWVYEPSIYQAFPMALPNRWLGYDFVDTVILMPINYRQVSERQWEALKRWVWLGGHLIVVTGSSPAQLQHPVVRELLPVTIEGTAALSNVRRNRRALDLPRRVVRMEVTVAVLKPDVGYRASGWSPETVREQEQTELVAHRYYGYGRCTFVGMDVNAAPFSTMAVARRALWQKLLAPHQGGGMVGMGRQYLEPVATQERDFYSRLTPKVAKPMSVGLVILFSIAYIVVVGPVAYSFVKRQNRLLLSLLFGAGSVAAFCVIAYLLSVSSRSNTFTVRDVSVLDFSVHDGSARGSGRAVFFLPKQGENKIVLARERGWVGVRDAPELVVRTEEELSFSASVLQDENRPVYQLRNKHWSTRLVEYKWIEPATAPSGIDPLARLQDFVATHEEYFNRTYWLQGSKCIDLGRLSREDLRQDDKGDVYLRGRETGWDLTRMYARHMERSRKEWPFDEPAAAVALNLTFTDEQHPEAIERKYPGQSVFRILNQGRRAVLIGFTEDPEGVIELDRFGARSRHVRIVRVPIPEDLQKRFFLHR